MTILKSFSYVFLIIFWIIQIKVVALHQKSKKYDMEQNVKELPYGVQDFVTIVEQNIYYVDKTMYIPELELNHGYCDFFLLPDLTHYATKHSYILEFKLVPKREKGMSEETYQANIKKQWQQAEVQIKQYAVAPRVEALRQGTTLHKIIMQFDGWNLLHMDEVH